MNLFRRLFCCVHPRTIRYTPRPVAKPSRVRLEVEILEDRLSPAVFNVSTTTDSSTTVGSLRYEIDQSNATTGPNTVYVPAGTYSLSSANGALTVSNQDLNIVGQGGSAVIQGGSGFSASIFDVTGAINVGFSNLTITGGKTSGNGGGVVSSQGNLSLSNTVVQGNTASIRGGGIYDSSGNVSITGGAITGNMTLNSGGGGIYDLSGNVTVSASSISGNTAYVNGGGIQDSKGNIFVSNTTISDNVAGSGPAGGAGGGICAATGLTGNITVSNSNINDNSATTGGGAYLSGTTLAMSYSNMDGNTASYGAGGMFASYTTASISGSVFSGNNGGQNYGGVYLVTNGGTGTVSADLITNNQSVYYAGGIVWVVNGGTSNLLSGTTFSGNSGKNGGLGAYVRSGSLTVSGSTFANNRASVSGGGIFATGSLSGTTGTLYLTNNTLFGNAAGSQGGALIGINGTVNMLSDTISANSANTGGGVYNAAASINVGSTIIASNTAPNGPDVFGAFTDQGFNLIGKSDGSSGFTVSTLVGTIEYPINPLLGPLQNNGGPTQTQALLPGSPALNAGNSAGAPPTDQRGFPRPTSGPTDIGAFENQSQLFTLTAPGNQTSDAGRAASFNLGSFTDSGTSGNIWVVDVNWGDGTPDTVFSTTRQGSLGTQSHTYTTAGSQTVTITINDADNNFALMPPFGVIVNPNIILSPTSIPSVTAGNSYTVGSPLTTFTAGGGIAGSYTFSAVGNLDGLNLSTGGALTGTPTIAGTFGFTVTAKDSGGHTGSQNYVLTVLPGAAYQVLIAGGNNQSATVGTVFANPLVAQVTDQYGNPVAGATVTFASTTGGNGQTGTFGGTTTVTTNSQGFATAPGLTANTKAGVYTVTATDISVGMATFKVTNNPAAPFYINAVAGTPQSKTVGQTYTTNLAAQVLDQYNNPVPGVTVLFALPITGGASGAFANGNSSVLATTTAGGIATATQFTANTEANTASIPYYTVNASVNGVGGPAIFQLSNTPGAVANLGLQFSVPGQMYAGTSMFVLVRALDSYGNLVTSDTHFVTLTTTGFSPELPKTLKLSGGQTTFAGIYENKAGLQTLTATDQTSGSIQGSRTVNVLPGAPTSSPQPAALRKTSS